MTPQFTITYAVNSRYSSVLNGKPLFDTEEEQVAFFSKFNGDFVTQTTSLEELIAHIEQGHPTTAALSVPYRHSRSFRSTQMIQLDFDNGATKESLLREFGDTAFALYTTPSHRPLHEKWRLVFILERELTDPNKVSLATKAIMFASNQKPDRSCSDPCRFFYGCGANGEVVVLGNILKLSTLATWVDNYNARPVVVTPQQEGIPLPPSERTWEIAVNIINRLGQHIAQANAGEKHNKRLWMAFTAGGYSQYITKREALSILLRYALQNTTLSIGQVSKVLSDGWDLGVQYPIPIVEYKLELATPSTNIEEDSYWAGFADGLKIGLDVFGIGHKGDDWLLPLRAHGEERVANTEIINASRREYTTAIAAPFTPLGQQHHSHIICPTPRDALAALNAYPDLPVTWSSMPDFEQVAPPNIDHWPPLKRTAILLEPHTSYRIGDLSNAKRVVRTPGKVEDMVKLWSQDDFMSLIRG